MNKYTIVIVATLLFAAQASAQEVQTSAISATSVAPTQRPMIQDMRGAYKTVREGGAARQAQQLRENMRGANETTRVDMRQGIKDMRAVATSTRQEMKNTIEQQREMVKQKMEQVKQVMEVRKEEFKKAVEMKKEETKKKIEENRAKLQERLKSIKDEKKKTAVETVDRQLTDLNANRVEHFTNVVDQIEKVLQNIGSREAKAEAAGKDVAIVKTDIAAAQAAIVAARAAIVAQSARTYALAIGQESTLRVDVEKSRKALATDLKAAEDKVKAAHEAIKKAATDLTKIQGVNTAGAPASTATSTGASTNQ